MSERAQLLLELADDELILGWRDSEWTGIAPFLEEDVAFSSIAQNEIGHARALYELAARDLGGDADSLAFDRRPEEYRCAPLVQTRLVGDWAGTIARHFLYETADAIRLEALKSSDDAELAGVAAKIDREEVYHRLHAEMWASKLREEPRFLDAARAAVAACARRRCAGSAAGARRAPGPGGGRGGRAGGAGARVRGVVGRDDDGAPLGAGRARSGNRGGGLGGAGRDPRSGDPGDLARRPRRRQERRDRRRARADRVHADVPGLPRARDDEGADGGGDRGSRRGGAASTSSSTTRGRPTGSPPTAARSSAKPASPRRRRAPPARRRSSSSSRRRSAARTAARARRGSTTSSAPRPVVRSATARAAASRSSSSRRSRERLAAGA